MAVLAKNPNVSLRNMVFYRQDYLDEFSTIWETQAKFRRGELNSPFTEELKNKIRDVIIFYQHRFSCQKITLPCRLSAHTNPLYYKYIMLFSDTNIHNC
jgi:hypothetical protein